MRKKSVVESDFTQQIRDRLLEMSKRQNYFCLLDSNRFTRIHPKNNTISRLAAFGAEKVIEGEGNPLAAVEKFISEEKDWLFGHIAYDYKNRLEKLQSVNNDFIAFPDITFFQPQCVISSTDTQLIFEYLPGFNIETFKLELFTEKPKLIKTTVPVKMEARESREDYCRKIKGIKAHIARGDIYEMNYCTEFRARNSDIDTVRVYNSLCKQAAAPMACYYKNDTRHLICGSPERYIRKQGAKLISQPIKGTLKRSNNPEEDCRLAKRLEQSLKDRTENIMIVDLVRNDLSRIAERASVKVSELCKTYTFTHWHQLISTIEAVLLPGVGFRKIMEASFPMGSMTGAPKISAMKLIEEYEEMKRGIYSGTVGYISPNGDFDFNVVIRSICFNSRNKYLSYIVGGAITAASQAEDEYEECLLKAKGIEKALKYQ